MTPGRADGHRSSEKGVPWVAFQLGIQNLTQTSEPGAGRGVLWNGWLLVENVKVVKGKDGRGTGPA